MWTKSSFDYVFLYHFRGECVRGVQALLSWIAQPLKTQSLYLFKDLPKNGIGLSWISEPPSYSPSSAPPAEDMSAGQCRSGDGGRLSGDRLQR